jgi:hypothetical protein
VFGCDWAQVKSAHGDDEPEKPVVVRKPPGPRWLTLSSSLFRRSIRLAFPAIA